MVNKWWTSKNLNIICKKTKKSFQPYGCKDELLIRGTTLLRENSPCYAFLQIMAKAKPNQTPRLKLNENKIRNALPKHILAEDKVEDYILKALEHYTKYMRNRYSIER